MAQSPNWLSSREDRAWRAFVHARDRLGLRLHRHLLRDSDLTQSDYEILAVLSEHPTGHMPSQELAALLEWEKSRLSHQALRMENKGFILRKTNPADARSVFDLPLVRRTSPHRECRAPARQGRSTAFHWSVHQSRTRH